MIMGLRRVDALTTALAFNFEFAMCRQTLRKLSLVL